MSEAEGKNNSDPSDELPSSGTLLGLPPAELAKAILSQSKKPKVPRAEDLIGTKLMGRYIVEGIVGRGGMAAVFAGRHLTINKAVAIKVLDPALLVPDSVERFLQEAQATSLVRHENVIEVTDFGTTEDGIVFSVMELLTGEALHETLENEGALPPARAVGIMTQICAGLHAAHEQGVIHRDLKPENCFRVPRTSNSDFIKVLDFGIAKVDKSQGSKVVTASPRQTQVGVIVGTPEFVAPEQARGEQCDRRTDVYAAGVMLYLMLSGKLPYGKSTAAELLSQHMYDPIPRLAKTCPGTPKGLSDAVAKAMAKDPDDRYASMAEMSIAIQATVRSAGNLSVARTALFEVEDRPRSRAWIWAIAVLLLGVGGFWAVSRGSSSVLREGEIPVSAAESVHVDQATEGTVVEGKSVTQAASSAEPSVKPEEASVAEPEEASVAEPEEASVAEPEEASVEGAEVDEGIGAEVDEAGAAERKPRGKARARRQRRKRKAAESSEAKPEPKAKAQPELDAAKISEVKNPFAD